MSSDESIDPEKFRALRKKLGFSQEEFGRKIGLTGTRIHQIEAKDPSPAMYTNNFRMLATECEMSLDKLRATVGRANGPDPLDRLNAAIASAAAAQGRTVDEVMADVAAMLESNPKFKFTQRLRKR